jgi:serine phosphatase RsbU (regulator of sigma subunit)
MSAIGLLIGAGLSALASWLVLSNFHIHDVSPGPYLLSLLIVVLLAGLASSAPAVRATLIPPMAAIRDDANPLRSSVRARYPENEGESQFDVTLLNDFVEASRRAGSFEEAARLALQMLRGKVHAQSAFLLERLENEFRVIASSPETLPGFSLPSGGFLESRLRFYTGAITFSPADLDAAHRWATEQESDRTGELEQLQRAGVCLAISLRTRADWIGLLLLGDRQGGERYSRADKRLLSLCGEQFALMLENGRLTQRVLEQEKIRRDVALAAEVQKRLLPQTSPDMTATELGAFTLPARSVGGDYYDFIELGKHRIAVALADVAGKGVAAALIMAVVQASLRILSAEGNGSLPDLASKMNQFLHKSTGVSSYATFFYAQLDEEKRELEYVNAGHNPPYLVRAVDTQIDELGAGGMIIGMFPGAEYTAATVPLQTGDVLVAFTDGVTEALNEQGEEFGEERVKELLRRSAKLAALDIRAAIAGELLRWMGTTPQHDDITFIVLKVN